MPRRQPVVEGVRLLNRDPRSPPHAHFSERAWSRRSQPSGDAIERDRTQGTQVTDPSTANIHPKQRLQELITKGLLSLRI